MSTRTTLALAVLIAVVAAPVAASSGVTARTDSGTDTEDCRFPLTVTDATGTAVTVEEEPGRVVTLRPSAAQTMWEIGAREKVVGVSKHARYLDGADEPTNVSGPDQTVIVERVVAVEPDLVLAPKTAGNETVEQLRGAGLTVYHFALPNTIDDVYAKTELIGRLVGACDGARETVEGMRERLETVDRAIEGEPRPDVLYAFFGFTAGEGTFVHEVIVAAGGNNVAAEHGIEGYRRLSDEVIVDADPDWIVRNSNDPVVPGGEPFDSTTAVREDQVVVVPIQHLNQPAPRIVRSITTLAQHFHPEAYAEANATATATSPPGPATTATTDGASMDDDPTGEASMDSGTTDEASTNGGTTGWSASTGTAGQSGFGLVAGLAAVAIALLAARGRP